ncbi:MAG TPA: Ig-like domain-containing protein, partial [Anaerolineales bacterium]|nr:Ig-like domain-containing protein [Anaerolineales bacterium]
LRDLAAGTFEQAGGSAVVMDPKTGEVLALVGKMSAGRPPGTLLTPYVHLAAYTHGFGPASLAWDIPSSLPQALGDFGQGSGQYEGPLRLRTALANDYLGPTLELLDLLGPQEVWESLTQLGFSSTRRDSLNGFDPILGGGEATLLETVHAYSVFSNLGLLVGEERPVEAGTEGAARIHPVTVLEIGDANGNLIRRLDQTASRPVISAQLAYLITHSLSDEAARWRSLGHPNSLEVGRPAAAKIGTTPVGDDIWTVGFSPNLVAGVWIGETAVSDGTEPVEVVGDSASRPSAEAATGLWHAVMQFASGNLPVMDWERPAAVSEVEVCDPSGLLPTAICPAIVSEVFLQGNEPTQLDNLYRKYLVNRETGRLATVFTPPELIEERVYMDIPPDAADWASQSGVETPPIDYDLIFTTSQDVPGVSLHAPPMFAYVRGVIPITGTASGLGFDYYRLQYGQGLNPQSWIQIGDDSSSDLEDGQLGVWDTNGLSGLYAVQLLVVRDDQRVDKATIQVTVDNAAPEVRILNPADGQEYPYTPGRSATLQVQVSDDLSLERVEYFLDDRLLASLAEPPYTLPVPFNPGEHTLRVVAYDRAGNRAEDRISFRVE